MAGYQIECSHAMDALHRYQQRDGYSEIQTENPAGLAYQLGTQKFILLQNIKGILPVFRITNTKVVQLGKMARRLKPGSRARHCRGCRLKPAPQLSGVPGNLPGLAEVSAKTDRGRVDFLRSDLALCFTYADIVETELSIGDSDGALMALAKCEAGYCTMCRFVTAIKNGESRGEIERKLNDLCLRLDQVRALATQSTLTLMRKQSQGDLKQTANDPDPLT